MVGSVRLGSTMNASEPTDAMPPVPAGKSQSKFPNVAFSGVTFQAGSAAVDSSTIMAALVHQLTGSSLAVGAVTTILRVGWLFPQLFVGFFAERRGSSLRYYAMGGFGRATCIGLLALILLIGIGWPPPMLSFAVLSMWTAYSFVSGIVAVPYNDIVARWIPSEKRSSLLATRFFGGGLLALGVAALADVFVGNFLFPTSYAAIFAMASLLMFVSSTVFIVMGEPEKVSGSQGRGQESFANYLREGMTVFRNDRQFRLFVYAQWFGGVVLMAMPFYIVYASTVGFNLEEVAFLLIAQTTGALASNILWGWWGDRLGKGSLLQAIAMGRVVPPILVLTIGWLWSPTPQGLLIAFLGLFFVLGALANGLTIAVIGYLMEISPVEKRPSYSGYFNALTSPAFLFPLLGGLLVSATGFTLVFSISLAAAGLQCWYVYRIRST